MRKSRRRNNTKRKWYTIYGLARSYKWDLECESGKMKLYRRDLWLNDCEVSASPTSFGMHLIHLCILTEISM